MSKIQNFCEIVSTQENVFSRNEGISRDVLAKENKIIIVFFFLSENFVDFHP